ncbi:fumarylacetoacetate hydrolase family protein [Paraburkholderia nemoris]|uniref:fumarylacetoacetate hydrolase family protein n=1 Tax=Paraburkholderia nemoris TaxID=2793076 RepID=UPI0038BAEC4E
MFKLGTFSQTGKGRFAALVFNDQTVVNIATTASIFNGKYPGFEKLTSASCVDDLLTEWERNFDALVTLADLCRGSDEAQLSTFTFALTDLRTLPPVIRPGKLVCHAQNYADHVMEMRRSQFGSTNLDLSKDFMGEKSKTWPYAFLKATSALTGAYDEIELPDGHPEIDWEAEMAIVIGTRGKKITEGNAMRHVAGLMSFNDVSCRDNLWRPDRVTLRSDWFAAKSFDTFAPAGPFLVPLAFIDDHMDLRITLSVNGELMQNGSTAGLIFSPEEQISFFSKSMTWFPGDMLATGTPAGTGQGVGKFLQPGDVVETEIAGLGVQRNRCVAQRDQQSEE